MKFAIKLEKYLSLNEESDSNHLEFKIEKVSSDLNKEIDRLNSYFSGETEQASSSNTTEESTTSKQLEKKHKQLESNLDNTENKKTKKR